MTGDVDQSQTENVIRRRWCRQGQLCETEVNRDAPLFFFRQPVWIGAGQGADKRTFAVVDMPGSRDDKMFVGHRARSVCRESGVNLAREDLVSEPVWIEAGKQCFR